MLSSNVLGPFDIPEPTRSRTGAVRASQRFTRGVYGQRIFDGPVTLDYADGRAVKLTSAGLKLTPENAFIFADRAYYEGVPAQVQGETE